MARHAQAATRIARSGGRVRHVSGPATVAEEAERLQAEADAADPSPARRLLRTLPWTPENMLVIAKEMLEDPLCGDVGESVMHGFAMALSGPEEAQTVLPKIQQMRRAHFKRLGKPVPQYAGDFVR